RGNPLWLPISRAATGGRPYNVCPRLPKKPPLLGCAARGWARVAVQLLRQTEKPGNKLKN
ncbi:MAG: hypothetical protein SWH68_00375, partial [Thermodesulfobacteriota bacterium]|nr:hypothetical protein [Thermodesulfobacteriota bacterium]